MSEDSDSICSVEDREAQPYIAIQATLPLNELADALNRHWPACRNWLEQQGVDPAGPPLLRWRVIDMARDVQVDIGIPVAGPVPAAGQIVNGEMPAGRYAVMVHRGSYDELMRANSELQQWGRQQGLEFQFALLGDTESWGARAEYYLTDPQRQPDPDDWLTRIEYLIADDS